MTLQIGEKLPSFSVTSVSANSHKTLTQNDFLNHYTVIYFYPKDSTPGCTTEGLDFSALAPDFLKLNTQIYGASLDSIKRHENFITKQNFSFELISDPETEFCKLFGVYQLKKNFGKEYMGIVRSTFIINKTGELIKEWRNVKVKGHAQEVLETLKNLQN
ncbi:peroxiredoxin [Thiomicrorhabdus sp. Milos-T2]|uniref:peroxiredoxin n=1 Tax=Thiomicrorhabdus sp. Milos-T2 TaxID=90814 RepID=UPI0004940889|nr:peroxiredoxin [Thiomicrorhabdus sp. Milos-T2]